MSSGEAIVSGSGYGTCNEAEYKAIILALYVVGEEQLRGELASIMLDSELVYRQMRGEWKVRSERLRKLHLLATHLWESLAGVELALIRSEENKAHRAAEEAMRKEPSPYDGVEAALREAAVWLYRKTVAEEEQV